MKKVFSLMLVLVLALSIVAFAACGDSDGGPSTITPDQTVTDEDIKGLLGDGALYVTTIGQADLSNAETVVKNALKGSERAGDYTKNNKLEAEDVEDGSTVVVVVGCSTKGLGAAGVTAADEATRASEFAAKADSINLIVLHLGKKDRRGETSDPVIKAIGASAKVCFVVDDQTKDGGNYDNLFTSYNTYTFTKTSNMVSAMKFVLLGE